VKGASNLRSIRHGKKKPDKRNKQDHKLGNQVTQTIATCLSQQALEGPGRSAIMAPGRSGLSYRGLWRQIEHVGERLNATGIGRNDRVAIVLPNGPEMAVAFVAVAAGATAAPLNPNCRQSDFEFYLSDLKAKAVILLAGAASAAEAAARACGIPIIELSFASHAEAGTFTLAGGASRVVRTGFAEEDDVALVLHTSGTTARPKIVPLTQRNLCASALNHRAALALTDRDVCLSMMPLFHIHGLVTVVLSSLMTGASVVCTPGFDAPKFFDWLEEFRPTWFTAAPALYQALLAYASTSHEIIAHDSLRFLRSAAAPLSPRLLEQLERLFKVPLIESYGMTEAAAQITSNPLPPGRRKAGSVGIASGPEVAIMGEDGTLLPPGKTGEIVIRGANVMAGYENNPAANSTSFADGWFRTGDQGFTDSDGYFFINGRIKEIINRGGEKISPREVDEVLLDHPAVIEAATFPVPHPRLGEDIAAAAVLRENISVTEKQIRDFALTRLSQQKVPSRILIVDHIPKSSTGKLQRARLAEALQAKLNAVFSPPRNAIENAIAKIWTEILGVDPVGIHDNFFALGGDSLSATRVVARLEDTLNLKTCLLTFFDYPTVAELAQMLAQNRSSGKG
jgi:acyl-CoA synthetase (AMP-forming)/AMP-acid ligase II/acyl carrier protein